MNLYQSDSLTHILIQVMKQHRHHIHKSIQEYEVYPGQPPLLFRLSEQDGQSQNELAAQMRVAPATLTVMINRMEKTGLVERRTDAQDQRISRVYLTDKGTQATIAVKETLRTLEDRCFTHFMPEEKLILRRLLLQMHENMKDPEENNS
ncbi:putative HTH-type transcriptional regulator YusO [compost metagenome]